MTSVPDVAVDTLNAAAFPNAARDAAPDAGNIFDGVLAEVIATAGNAGGGDQEDHYPFTGHDEVDPTALVNEAVVVAVPVSPAQIWNLMGTPGKTDDTQSGAVRSAVDAFNADEPNAHEAALAPHGEGLVPGLPDDASAAIHAQPSVDLQAAIAENAAGATVQATTDKGHAAGQNDAANAAPPLAEQIAAMVEQDAKPRASASAARASTAPKQAKREPSAINTSETTRDNLAVAADDKPVAVTNVQRVYSTEDRDLSRWFSQTNEFVPERGAQTNQSMATVSFAVPIDASSTLVPRSAPAMIDTPGAAAGNPAIETHVPQQIVQSIRMQALNGGGEAIVRLRPDYLGEVVVAVKVDQGSVTAALHADTPQVRQWAERNEAVLRDSLAQQGLQLDRLTVTHKPAEARHEREPHRQQPRDEQPRQQSRRRRANAGDATFEVTV